MNSIQMWAVLLGIVTPFLVAIVAQPRWTAPQKRVFSVVVAIVVGVINLGVQGAISDWSFSPGNLLTNIVLVLGASQAAYSLLWKPSGVADNVERVTAVGEPS